MVSHVIVNDIKYDISCRLMSVCFRLRELSVLHILLHSIYSKVIYIMQKDSCLVWKCLLPPTSGIIVLTLSDPMSDLVRHYDFPVPNAFLDL
jgi:hypothetical protein